MSRVKTAVITAGGFGSRFLPATKSIPKELIPLINKPIIYYIVEQCVAAGIEHVIIVNKPENSTIEDFFSPNAALEDYLISKGKTKELDEVRRISSQVKITVVNQDETLPYGNARPLYTVRDLVGNEPFVYSYGDDLIFGDGAGIPELVDVYEKTGADAVLMCTEVPDSMVEKVGIIQPDPLDATRVKSIIEKPSLAEAPSRLASVAAYVFTSQIFDHLDPSNLGNIGEFYLQAGLDEIIHTGSVRACVTKGKWLTNGDPLNYLKSTVEIALSRDDVKTEFLAFLKEKLAQNNTN